MADDAGKVALERGPLVYCAEGSDNAGSVLDLVVPDDARLTASADPTCWAASPCCAARSEARAGKPRELVAIPYYAWSHRGPGEMAVWLKRPTGGAVSR